MNNCRRCDCDVPLEFDIAMAFQPIVDLHTCTLFAYEALVRGVNGEGAGQVLSKVTEKNRYSFDQTCRTTAIRIASELGCNTRLSINFLPNAVYEPEACLRETLKAAQKYGFPYQSIIFEVTEHEKVDVAKILDIFRTYQKQGFMTAIDDFGEGYSGLNLLAMFQPDIIKLDMLLIRGIDKDPAKQAIFSGMALITERLGIKLLAEGVETEGEFTYLREKGVRYMQGYYICKPLFMTLADEKQVFGELDRHYDH
ncbi:EAL domain-containing protein [Bowmanella yangjiangensis]|uniref:EAL domain-containing protein n=1 Tax=Bowmanella yangjiangensis TaxID=2811230 RepID=A0ABS3CPQ0_9ALTE|nr:EAL domain-containing protein [Bowmanella yangjiangensis]MBN7819062.1 EAL domain-containing protein [Bowmanella yangjiangensis]